MHHQITPLTLPLPHSWFHADTTLPKTRFRPSRVPEGLSPIDALAARILTLDPVAAQFDAGDSTLDTAQRLFDSYFAVTRTEAPPVAVLRAALRTALPDCIADIRRGVSLGEDDLGTLALGLQRLADWALVPAEFPAARLAHLPDLDVPADAADLLRWKLQHHLFFLIIHGMLYLLHVLEEALDREHAPVVQAILGDFAELMDASTAAFRLAGDLTVAGYETQVRPDMHRHDPHFSGLFYADHKELVTSLRVLKRVPDDFAEELNRIGAALDGAYEAHALVCLRFVGQSASLASKDESRIAAESIRGKYVKRTKVIAGLAKPR